MEQKTQNILEKPVSKVQDYVQLAKLRLATSVVFSAMIAYLLGVQTFNSATFLLLLIGGFLVVGSSNGFNQIIEREYDAIMDRTSNRPLPAGRMGVLEAMIACSIMGVLGVGLLYVINPLSAFFGALALLLYTLVYTPLKRKTPWAVFVGAFPGAIPFMLGWVAATNDFGIEPVLLFAIQFIWQFPHFWALAWILDEDYKKAGYSLLPGKEKGKQPALQSFLYTLWLIPISILPVFGFTGDLFLTIPAAILIGVLGLWLLSKTLVLMRNEDDPSARKLFIATLAYLPLIQIIYVVDRWI
ncbi:MAG: protoheme IX farnesyltransferase [Flavobacteriales bacterium]|jgi:protoheme IX farnesyltransferase